MSTSKKSIKKRKLPSSPSQTTSQVNRRLEVLRSGQRNLWDDDDDDSDLEPYVKLKKPTTINKTYIVISDSDNEKTSSRRRSKSNKSKKKSSRTCDESLTSDNDHKRTSKCTTCLICSILTTLTSYNCCSKHLSLLINNKNSHDNDQKQTINTNQWPPKQVMIVPITDEFIQRYINPQEFVHIKTSTSPIHKKSVQSNRSIRKLSKKSRITSESSDAEHSIINKIKSSTKSSRVELEQPNSSSIVIESVLPTNSGKISQDATYTVITSTSTSTSTTVNSFESPNILDTCQIQQSSDQLITIDDSQPNTQQDNLLTHNIQKNQTNDPWTPISDDTYVAIETALYRIDSSSQEKHEFTPITARRTPTDLMASRLPKIQLKKGRFHQGKPIVDKNVSDTTTNGCQSSTICQSSSSSSTSTSTSIIITNNRPAPSSLETIIEDESLVIQSTHQISDKSSPSCHGLSQQPENTTDGLSDTVMSCLFAQDESSQHDNIHITTKTISNEAVPPPPLLLPTIIIEDYSHKNDINNKSVDISQSSQLTNDQTDFQQLTPSTTNEKPTRIARRSYRMNPDGSRVSISRSSISTYRQSSSTSLRRLSNDVTPTASRTRK